MLQFFSTFFGVTFWLLGGYFKLLSGISVMFLRLLLQVRVNLGDPAAYLVFLYFSFFRLNHLRSKGQPH